MSTSGGADSDVESFSTSEAPSEFSRSASHCALACTSCFALVVSVCGSALTVAVSFDDSFIFSTSVSEGGGRREIVLAVMALYIAAFLVAAWGLKASRSVRRGEVACVAAIAAFLGCACFVSGFIGLSSRAGMSPEIIRAGNEFCENISGNCSAASLGGQCAGIQRCVEPVQFDDWRACVCSSSFESSTGSRETLRGSSCRDWDSDGSESWCFVNAGVGCGNVTLDDVRAQYRSAGPCGNGVESRSQPLLDGLQAFDRVIGSAVVIALALLFASAAAVHACGCCVGRRDDYGDLRSLVAESDREGLVSRFESAQQLAVRRMKNTTSDQMRLNLYSFYMQATKGDVKGPPLMNLSKNEMSKYEAWASAKGLASEEAMRRYIDVVNKL